MSVKKLSFYINTAKVTVRDDHLPSEENSGKEHHELKSKQLGSRARVTEHQFPIYPRHKNTLADTLSRLIEIDDDIKLPPEG